MVNFFRSAFAPTTDLPRTSINPTMVNPQVPARQMNQTINFIQNSTLGQPYVTTSALLTPLFAIYTYMNNLQKNALFNMNPDGTLIPEKIQDPKTGLLNKDNPAFQRQYLGADKLLRDSFATEFGDIQRKSVVKLAKELVASGKLVLTQDQDIKTLVYANLTQLQLDTISDSFNGKFKVPTPIGKKPSKKIQSRWFYFRPQNFRFADFQSIVAQSRLKSTGIPQGILNTQIAKAVTDPALAKKVLEGYRTQVCDYRATYPDADGVPYLDLAVLVQNAFYPPTVTTRGGLKAANPSLYYRALFDEEQVVLSHVLDNWREKLGRAKPKKEEVKTLVGGPAALATYNGGTRRIYDELLPVDKATIDKLYPTVFV